MAISEEDLMSAFDDELDEYFMDMTEASTITISADDLYLGSTVTNCTTSGPVNWPTDVITLNGDSSNLTISNNTEIIVERNGGNIKLIETIQEQQMQIQALTDMISEMVEQGDFKIDWDLEKRVDQKKFLKKLST